MLSNETIAAIGLGVAGVLMFSFALGYVVGLFLQSQVCT